MPANFAYLVQMDIPAEHEADFNRVYDTEHAKYICNAPGVHSCDRFLLKFTDAPRFARYAALYGIDDPGVPTSAGWQAESEKGDWATKIRPHATNRSHTILQAIADSGNDAGDAGYIYVVQTDIAPEAEDEFNHLYDSVHLPGLCQVDGVVSARRYRVDSTNLDGLQMYAAVYRITGPEVVESDAWKAAAQDEWAAKVRKHCIGLTHALMECVARHHAA